MGAATGSVRLGRVCRECGMQVGDAAEEDMLLNDIAEALLAPLQRAYTATPMRGCGGGFGSEQDMQLPSGGADGGVQQMCRGDGPPLEASAAALSQGARQGIEAIGTAAAGARDWMVQQARSCSRDPCEQYRPHCADVTRSFPPLACCRLVLWGRCRAYARRSLAWRLQWLADLVFRRAGSPAHHRVVMPMHRVRARTGGRFWTRARTDKGQLLECRSSSHSRDRPARRRWPHCYRWCSY